MFNLPCLPDCLLPCSHGDAKANLREMKIKSGEGGGGGLGGLRAPRARPTAALVCAPTAPVPLPPRLCPLNKLS